MKKLILVLCFLFWSTSAFGIFGFGKKEKPILPPKPQKCHYSIHIRGEENEPKVFYIFIGPCGTIRQVGIIDEIERIIFELNGKGILSETKYYGNSKKQALVSTYWGDLKPIEFYEK